MEARLMKDTFVVNVEDILKVSLPVRRINSADWDSMHVDVVAEIGKSTGGVHLTRVTTFSAKPDPENKKEPWFISVGRAVMRDIYLSKYKDTRFCLDWAPTKAEYTLITIGVEIGAGNTMPLPQTHITRLDKFTEAQGKYLRKHKIQTLPEIPEEPQKPTEIPEKATETPSVNLDERLLGLHYRRNIIEMMDSQTLKGMKEYGQPLEENKNLSMEQRMVYLSEELVDGLVYIQHLMAGVRGMQELMTEAKELLEELDEAIPEPTYCHSNKMVKARVKIPALLEEMRNASID